MVKLAYADADFVVIAAPTNYDSVKRITSTQTISRGYRSHIGSEF